MLEVLCLRGREIEDSRDGDIECRASPVEHACELARHAVGDDERRPVMADRDDDDGGVLARRDRCRAERTEQREGLEIDADQLHAGHAAGAHVALDEVAIGYDQQHAVRLLALFVRLLADDLVVEHRLLERDRQHLLGAEADRVLEMGRVGEAADLEAADADAVGAHTEANALHRKLVLAEELLEVRAERVGVTELAADDDAAVERLTCELYDVDLAVLADVRGGDMGGADLQPDDLALLARGALGGLGRARLGGGLRPAPERELDRPARLLLIGNLRGLLGCGGGAPRGEAGEAARLLLLGRVLARRRPSEAARLLLLGRVLTLRRPGEAARLLLLGRILTLLPPRRAALAAGRRGP